MQDSITNIKAAFKGGSNFLLPPLNSTIKKEEDKREYTLVLDMDETLIHVDPKRPHVVGIRPNCRKFMAEMAKLFEIIIFTCGLKDYAEYCLAKLDPKNEWITHRLYRESCTHFRGAYYKDLSRLDRDLSKTLIVDNWPENFAA